MRLILSFLFCVSFAFSQSDNQAKIAYQFYQNGEYEKAIEIYKKLSTSSNFHVHYHNYFQSLIHAGYYQEAKRLSRRMIRKFPSKLIYIVDLYICQYSDNDIRGSTQTLDQIYSKIVDAESQVMNVANTFIRYQKYEEALSCYLLFKHLDIENKRLYNTQVAQIYQYLGKDEEMIEEYLSLLEKDPSQKNSVMFYLQKYLDNNGIYSEKNYELVRDALLIYSQQEKTSSLFSELLIWMFMQNNEFELAFLQAKSLDRRLNEDGERIYEIAEVFSENRYYDIAIRAYDYIIGKGSSNYYFIDAYIDKLYVMQLVENPDVIEIDRLYQSIIEQMGRNVSTVSLLNHYAYFKAFSLSDLEGSKIILEDIMQMYQVSKMDLAECKLVYADVMLLSGNVWTALLYYSQVEKDHKEEPIGHEAKLRRAKISYYKGDFKWAQSQLDILKASTSKLIANDAMELSLLITDNLNLDTSEVPMRTYAAADLLYYQGDYVGSMNKLDSILSHYPSHSLVDDIYFRKHKIYLDMHDIDSAIYMLQKLCAGYSFDILYDDALFELANIYQFKKSDINKALEYYEMILFKCKGSIYLVESRKRYRELRGDKL